MTITEELHRLRSEMRFLRQHTAIAQRWQAYYHLKRDELSEKIDEIEQKLDEVCTENERLKKENQELKEELEKVQRRADQLTGMVFKANRPQHEEVGSTRRRGGQQGHPGASRRSPRRIDQEVRVFLDYCTTCDTALDRSNTVYERIVEEYIPARIEVTKYHIERQWCSSCKKEVRGVPAGTMPGFRFGLNLLTHILIDKYRLRLPLGKIKEELGLVGLSISEGGLQRLLHAARKRLGSQYDRILKTIRGSPVKHADETSWRIAGQNSWCWLFATPRAAYYTIEETRGKGVPQKILNNSSADSILIRDDYAAYEKLPLQQQSCWAHLLRVSREWTHHATVSPEMQKLHTELKELFGELATTIAAVFDRAARERAYQLFLGRITTIIHRLYRHADARAVQTRIRNQGKNLLTTVLYSQVPLTNNHAERQIRPLTVTRKISGGSQSAAGAKTHAVNMSVMQTIALQGKSYLTELTKLLSPPTQAQVTPA